MASKDNQSSSNFKNDSAKLCKSDKCHYNDHYFNKWLEQTTLNGIIHVFKGKSKIRRILWAVIFVGAVFGCLFTVGDSLYRFIQKPTATTITVESAENSGLPFPAVTICSLNTPDTSDQEYTAELLEILFNPDLAFDLGIFTNIKSCEALLNNISDFNRYKAIWKGLQEAYEGFVYFCGFIQGVNSELVHCEKKLQPVLTSLGICYTFNSITNGEPDLYLKATGARYGLKMVLNISQSNHPSFDGNSGVKVVVHERDDIARPNLYGFGIPPGRNAYIGVRKKTTIDHTSNTECINDLKLSFYPQFEYSQFACRQNAIVEYLAQPNTCNCVLDPARPSTGPYVNTPNCTFNDSCCLIKHYSMFDPRVGCLLPCRFEYYANEISYTSFPTGPFLETLAQSLNTTTDTIQGDIMSVHVYFEDLQVTTSITEYSYPLTAFLGEVGGNIGLFIGASIITLLEIVFFILDEIKRICFTERCQKKQQRGASVDHSRLSPDMDTEQKEA